MHGAYRAGLITFHLDDTPIEPRNLEELEDWCESEALVFERRWKPRPPGTKRQKEVVVSLTPAGGALWTSIFEPDWALYFRTWGFCDEPFEVPLGFEGLVLEGWNAERLEEERVRQGATLLKREIIDDWSPCGGPAPWLPPRPGHRLRLQRPIDPHRPVDLEEWRLSRYCGVTADLPENLAADREWVSTAVPVAARPDARIWDVLVGPERLQLQLRLGRLCSGTLEIRGAREVLEEPRRVASTAVLHRIQATATGFVLDIVWETGHGRVIEAEQLVLPNTTALWWTHRPR